MTWDALGRGRAAPPDSVGGRPSHLPGLPVRSTFRILGEFGGDRSERLRDPNQFMQGPAGGTAKPFRQELDAGAVPEILDLDPGAGCPSPNGVG